MSTSTAGGDVDVDKNANTSSVKKKKSSNGGGRLAVVTGGIGEVMSDNTMISVYPLGSNYFCFYESPFLQQVMSLIRTDQYRVNLDQVIKLVAAALGPIRRLQLILFAAVPLL